MSSLHVSSAHVHAPDCDLPGPIPGACSPSQWVRQQASYYRSLDSPWADWLAGQVENLANEVLQTGASTPAEHDDRIETMEKSRIRNLIDVAMTTEALKAVMVQVRRYP